MQNYAFSPGWVQSTVRAGIEAAPPLPSPLLTAAAQADLEQQQATGAALEKGGLL